VYRREDCGDREEHSDLLRVPLARGAACACGAKAQPRPLRSHDLREPPPCSRHCTRDRRREVCEINVLSGSAQPAVRDEVLKAGADLFLKKPCLPEELEAAMRALCISARSSLVKDAPANRSNSPNVWTCRQRTRAAVLCASAAKRHVEPPYTLRFVVYRVHRRDPVCETECAADESNPSARCQG
jgi:hypothetical protein